MKSITSKIDKKHGLLHHPVDLKTIPHIVTLVTVVYMFAVFLLSVGFVAGYNNGALQNNTQPANPVIEGIDTFPVVPEDPYFDEYVEEMEMYFEDLEETSYEQDPYYAYQDQGLPEEELYYEGYSADEYYQDDNYVLSSYQDYPQQEPYYDQEYSEYWEDTNDQQAYNSASDVDVFPINTADTGSSSFVNSISTAFSSTNLLTLGFWVLMIGVLVYIVNYIHDTSNPHFTPVAKKAKSTSSKKVKKSSKGKK